MKRTIQSPPKKNVRGNNIARAQPTGDDLSYSLPDRPPLSYPLGGIGADLVIETAVAQPTVIPSDVLMVLGSVDSTCRSLTLPSPARSSISVLHDQLNHVHRLAESEASPEACAEQHPKQPAITHLNSSDSCQI